MCSRKVVFLFSFSFILASCHVLFKGTILYSCFANWIRENEEMQMNYCEAMTVFSCGNPWLQRGLLLGVMLKAARLFLFLNMFHHWIIDTSGKVEVLYLYVKMEQALVLVEMKKTAERLLVLVSKSVKSVMSHEDNVKWTEGYNTLFCPCATFSQCI